jgi:hypothetical protein
MVLSVVEIKLKNTTSSTNITYCHNIAETMLNGALNTIILTHYFEVKGTDYFTYES